MAILKIKRSSELNNRARNFGLHLNGEKIGEISDGKTLEHNLEAGNYRLMAKIDWCQSKTINFEVKDDETKVVALSGFKFANWVVPLFAVITVAFYVLKVAFDTEVLPLLIAGIAIFLYPMYFISIGRKRYI